MKSLQPFDYIRGKRGFTPLILLFIIGGLIIIAGAYTIGKKSGVREQNMATEQKGTSTVNTTASSSTKTTTKPAAKSVSSSQTTLSNQCGGTVTVSVPTSGQKLRMGDFQKIAWSTNFPATAVQLQLETYAPTLRNPAITYIITGEIPNSGSYNWKIGYHQDSPTGSGTSTIPGKYVIRAKTNRICNNVGISGLSGPVELIY